jgi:predicted metal-dependent peptidase
MTTPDPTAPGPKPDRSALSLATAKRALRGVCGEMPHLAGLANLVRIKATHYYAVAAVGASGLLCVNPDVFATIRFTDAVFVLAHELLHLALDTHRRQGEADPYVVNVAHDYVINDILKEELCQSVPLGGLERGGARNESLEKLVVELSRGGRGAMPDVWSVGERRLPRRRLLPGKSSIQQELEKAGLIPPEEPPPPEPGPSGRVPRGDLIPGSAESVLEPGVSLEERRKQRQAVRKAAAKALSLGALRARMDESQKGQPAQDPERGEMLVRAIHTAYQPPWQLALQRWMDAVAPAGRTYAKASRRGAERDDGVVLCGRLREGWTLHIVLDTSGSMEQVLPKVLGTIASFCDGAGVSEVHILQCDIEVTRDEWLEPPQLSEYKIAGFGGSNMSPAMDALAIDSEVSAVLVLTDGYINYPAAEPPYSVLWGVVRAPTGYEAAFRPPYGEVLFFDP